MSQIENTLFISLRSPFARRIRLALHRLKIPSKEIILDVFQENTDLLKLNPLGTVPTLLTPSGALSDSSLILEYLQPTPDPASFFSVRNRSVLAAGIMQSLVLFYQETKMHEHPSDRWVKEHQDVIYLTLQHLEKISTPSTPLSQADWDLAVALEYMDLRMPELDWRKEFPSLIQTLTLARADAFFCETTPPPVS